MGHEQIREEPDAILSKCYTTTAMIFVLICCDFSYWVMQWPSLAPECCVRVFRVHRTGPYNLYLSLSLSRTQLASSKRLMRGPSESQNLRSGVGFCNFN
eukprot:3269130-Amphidinium_carterae.1